MYHISIVEFIVFFKISLIFFHSFSKTKVRNYSFIIY